MKHGVSRVHHAFSLPSTRTHYHYHTHVYTRVHAYCTLHTAHCTLHTAHALSYTRIRTRSRSCSASRWTRFLWCTGASAICGYSRSKIRIAFSCCFSPLCNFFRELSSIYARLLSLLWLMRCGVARRLVRSVVASLPNLSCLHGTMDGRNDFYALPNSLLLPFSRHFAPFKEAHAHMLATKY